MFGVSPPPAPATPPPAAVTPPWARSPQAPAAASSLNGPSDSVATATPPQMHVHTIAGVSKTLNEGGGCGRRVGGLAALTLEDGGDMLPLARLAEMPNVVLYCVDEETNALVFVEVGGEGSIYAEGFLDRATAAHPSARAAVGGRAYIVPLAAAAEAAAEVDTAAWEVLWVWNTGRCGSTLVHRTLTTAGVLSLSESYWLDQLSRRREGGRDVDPTLLHACLVLGLAQARAAGAGPPRFAVNPKCFSHVLLDNVEAAGVGGRRHLFLQRRFDDVVDSFAAVYEKEGGGHRAACADPRPPAAFAAPALRERAAAEALPALPELAADVWRLPGGSRQPMLPAVAWAWIDHVLLATDALRTGLDAATLCYDASWQGESGEARKLRVAAALLQWLRLPSGGAAVGALRDVLRQNSQTGTGMVRSERALGPADRALLVEFAERCGVPGGDVCRQRDLLSAEWARGLATESIRERTRAVALDWLQQFHAHPEVAAITLVGGVADGDRRFVDRYSDVDVILWISLPEATRRGVPSMRVLQQDHQDLLPDWLPPFKNDVACTGHPDGEVEIQVHQEVVELQRPGEWDEGRKEAYVKNHEFIYEAGEAGRRVRELAREGVVWDEQRARRDLLKNLRRAERFGVHNAHLAVRRGCVPGAHDLMNDAVGFLVHAVYLINRVYRGHAKWRLQEAFHLPKRPDCFQDRVEECMLVPNMDAAGAEERSRRVAALLHDVTALARTEYSIPGDYSEAHEEWEHEVFDSHNLRRGKHT